MPKRPSPTSKERMLDDVPEDQQKVSSHRGQPHVSQATPGDNTLVDLPDRNQTERSVQHQGTDHSQAVTGRRHSAGWTNYGAPDPRQPSPSSTAYSGSIIGGRQSPYSTTQTPNADPYMQQRFYSYSYRTQPSFDDATAYQQFAQQPPRYWVTGTPATWYGPSRFASSDLSGTGEENCRIYDEEGNPVYSPVWNTYASGSYPFPQTASQPQPQASFVPAYPAYGYAPQQAAYPPHPASTRTITQTSYAPLAESPSRPFSPNTFSSQTAPPPPPPPHAGSRPPPELIRGHLAQANFHGAVYGRPQPLPHQYPEQVHRRNAHGIKGALPKPPPHSDFALWVGNVPSDATHSELWRFFNSRPPPTVSGLTHSPSVPEEERAPLDWVGVESIHLIARSNCCFVNYASQVHLDQAILACQSVPLRPDDPRCKGLVCRVRKKDDDTKTGVGAQRGRGVHHNWVASLQEQQHRSESLETTPGSVSPSEGTGDASSAPPIVRQPSHKSSASTDQSFASTSSTFLSKHFSKRYFVLKSHTEEDLDLSVTRGVWATQSHNEPVLDQAFRTAREGVFLIFSANKTGEFYGFAKMTGPVLRSMTDTSNSAPTSGSNSTSLRQRNMTILEGQTFQSPSPLTSSSKVPSANESPVAFAPSSASTSDSETQSHLEAARELLLQAEVSDPIIIEPPSKNATSIAVRRGAQLDADALADAPGGIRELSQPPSAEDVASALGASSRIAEMDLNGVSRKDTLLSPHERNARLELLSQEGGLSSVSTSASPVEKSQDKTLNLEKSSDKSGSVDKGWGRPFRIEWIKVQKLPFAKTRHLKNAFNANREVKISRDGTEIDPVTGEQLLGLFFNAVPQQKSYSSDYFGSSPGST